MTLYTSILIIESTQLLYDVARNKGDSQLTLLIEISQSIEPTGARLIYSSDGEYAIDCG